MSGCVKDSVRQAIFHAVKFGHGFIDMPDEKFKEVTREFVREETSLVMKAIRGQWARRNNKLKQKGKPHIGAGSL